MSRDVGLTCPEARARIEAYLEGALGKEERARVEAHLASCSACAAHVTRTAVLGGATGQSSGQTAKETEHLLGLFRAHGHHAGPARRAEVPLGISRHRAAEGDHIAYLASSEAEIDAAAGFLKAGFEADEVGVLLGPADAVAQTLDRLQRDGVKPKDKRKAGRLHTIEGGNSGAALLGELAGRISEAVTEGLPRVRILARVGWGRPDWPPEQDLLRLEAETTEAIRRLPTIVMCIYDVRALSPRVVKLGGAHCHPWTLQRGELRDNEDYVPADRSASSE